jgi:hypothetical protein
MMNKAREKSSGELTAMNPNAARPPCLKAGPEPAGRQWKLMNRHAPGAGLLAGLCALAAASALAQFSDYQEHPWQGGVFNFYGNTLITTPGTFNNSAGLSFNASTLPADTGPLFGWDLTPGVTWSGNYYFGVGVLVNVSTGTNAINNNPGGTMQGIVTGTGEGYASGVYAGGSVAIINNSGLMDGEVWNNDGTATGVYAGGVVTVTNNAGATLSATAPYYAGGIYTVGGGAQTIVNNGTIRATATGATQGSTSNQAYCAGIDVFTYDPSDKSPIYVVNNGSITVGCTDGATNISHAGAMWDDQNNVTWINNGTMTATMTGTNGDASGIYFGANNADVTFINTGTVNNGGGPGGEGVWMENDGTSGNMYFYNSGMIASGEPFAVSIAAYSGGPWGTCFFTNTGTIIGGWLGLGWPGNLNLYDSGDIHTALSWLGTGNGNDNVYISGLPTIDPVMTASSGGSNTLVFDLAGTLQSVNGSPASGTNLSAFALGSSGNIVVSGKTYSWSNFTNVSGTITAPVTLLAGPAGLTAKATSSSQAQLAWNALTNAASYNVKRSTTSDGPYTTIASGVASTNYTDPAAFISVEYYYVLSAIVGGRETANSAEVALRHPKLTGTIIGTPGSWNNSGNTISNVFDNNLDTFFDAPNGNGDWVGLDFGAGVSNVITGINYCPRAGFESRMVGGIFRGANQASFSDEVTLSVISNQPIAGMFTSVSLTNTSAFRYVFFLSPNGGYGNVAELQFYSAWAGAPPPTPDGLAAAVVSSNQISLTWNGLTNAATFNVKRSSTNDGPYSVIASGVTATNYLDSGLGGGVYYYVVSAVNSNGESFNSAQASAAIASPYNYSWGSPVPFAGLNANQILTNFPGSPLAGAMFAENGGKPITVTPGSGSPIVFAPANTSWASLAGGDGYNTGAWSGSTANANFNNCLNAFYFDGNTHTITMSGLVVGQPYSVQLFALDDRSLSPAGSARTVDWQNPADSIHVSAAYSMAANDYIIGTFTASNSVEAIQENMLDGDGNFNCLVLRAAGWNPPPYFIVEPGNVSSYFGNSVSLFGAAAGDSTIPNPTITYQWAAGPAGGPYTALVEGVKYSGTATTNLIVNNLTTNDTAVAYVLIASNGGGSSTTSKPAHLAAAEPPPLTLVGHWLAGAPNFSETSGYSPAGAHDGWLVGSGAALWTNDAPPNAPPGSYSLYFNNAALAISNSGSGDLNYTNTYDGGLTNSFSLMFWAKGFPQTWNPWVSKGAGGATGFSLCRNGGNNDVDYIVRGAGGTDGDNITASINSNDGQWHHYAGAYDPITGIGQVYVDGVLAGWSTGNGSFQEAPSLHLVIGGRDESGSFGELFDGGIYDVRIYNSAAGQSQIRGLAALTPPSPTSEVVGGKQVVVTWTWGTLLETTNLLGPWTPVSTASPYTNSLAESAQFFRVSNP